jgi:hypothetical protein
MNKADLITVLQNESDLTKSEAESVVNLFCNLNRAIFKFAIDIRKMSFRYSFLCGMASDTIDAVKLEIPQGFKFLKFRMPESYKILLNKPFQKFETISLGLIK